MRRTTLFAVLLMLSPALAWSQADAPTLTATDVTSADVQAAVKRGQEAVKAPGALNDRLITVADMGQYNVGVAMVVRTATATPTGAFSHLKVTEVYYILRGSGVQVTGTLAGGTGGGPDPLIGPTLGGRSPLQNARSSRLGPGDIQIIPPGVGHAWTSIDEGGIEYLVYRVDPDHLLALPSQVRRPGTIVSVDAANGVVIIHAGGQDRTLRVARDVRVMDADDRPLADGLRAAALKTGAEVTVTVDESMIQTIRLPRPPQ